MDGLGVDIEPVELPDVLNAVDERMMGLSVMCLGLEQLGGGMLFLRCRILGTGQFVSL